MRLEINAGGLMGMVTVAELYASINGYVHATENVIDSFADIRDSTYELNGGVGDLVDAVDCIEARIEEENEKYTAEIECGRAINEFLELAKQVDREVAEEVRELEEAFYQANPWARPPEPARPEDKDLFDWIGDVVSGWIEGAAEVVEKITKFASEAWQSIKDFIDEHKEAIAFVMKVVGYTAFIIGGILITVICPVTIVGVLEGALAMGALSFGTHSIIGTADELKEHGSDFASYDMDTVYKNAALEGVEDALSFIIGKGIDAVIGKLLPMRKLTKFLDMDSGKVSLKTLSKWIGYNMGKNVVSGMAERTFVGTIMEAGGMVFGEEFNMDDVLQETFSIMDIAVDMAGGVLEGSMEYIKNVDEVISTQKINKQIDDISVFTKDGVEIGPDQAFEYTGPGARKLAELRADETGKVTLEMTDQGKYFDDMELYDKVSRDRADDIMKKLSKKFAQFNSGLVEIVDTETNFDIKFNNKILYQVEIPNFDISVNPVRTSTMDDWAEIALEEMNGMNLTDPEVDYFDSLVRK